MIEITGSREATSEEKKNLGNKQKAIKEKDYSNNHLIMILDSPKNKR